VKVEKGKESEGGQRASRVKVEKRSRKVKVTVEKGKESKGGEGASRVKVEKG
jgi:hypothetical protein